jgi:hypothetical protein
MNEVLVNPATKMIKMQEGWGTHNECACPVALIRIFPSIARLRALFRMKNQHRMKNEQAQEAHYEYDQYSNVHKLLPRIA